MNVFLFKRDVFEKEGQKHLNKFSTVVQFENWHFEHHAKQATFDLLYKKLFSLADLYMKQNTTMELQSC